MANGFVPTQAAFVQGPDISGLMGGAGQQRAQEQQQKSMLSALTGVDMTGMSEQGIGFAQSMRDSIVDSLVNGDEEFGYEEFIQRIIGLQDFIVRDKKTYAENLSVAKPILDASFNDATYDSWKKSLEDAGKYMSQEAVQEYAKYFNQILENPYPGNYFSATDMMLFADDPSLAARNMMPAAGMNILGVELPQEDSFQYELQDLPTGDVFAYMKSGAESNLLSLLGAVDNEVDARQKIAQHYQTFVLGLGAGRRALQESFAGQSYFIKDLADKLVDFEGLDPVGMGDHILSKGDALGRSFQSNNEIFYKKFEEYYMDMFKAQQRDAALQLQKANKPDEPKYSFKTEMVPVASPPDFEVLSRGLSDSKIISLDDEGVDPLTIADEQGRIIDSIEKNGFMTLGGNETITLAGTPGTDQPDFVTDAVSVAQRYDGKKYLVLGGNTTEPVIETTDMEPEPGTKVVEVIDPTGVDYDKRWRIQTGEQTTPKVKAYRITDPESIAYFESLGKAFRKNVDIEDVNIMETDESVANMRLGLAIFTLKFKHAQSSAATAPFKSNIFSESDIREAQRVVNKYKFEF